MVTRALASASSLLTMKSMRQQGECVCKLLRLAHSWARALVSGVKKAGHWALCADANKSLVSCPNIIENLSNAPRWREYSSSSKDILGKTSVSRGLGATIGPANTKGSHNNPFRSRNRVSYSRAARVLRVTRSLTTYERLVLTKAKWKCGTVQTNTNRNGTNSSSRQWPRQKFPVSCYKVLFVHEKPSSMQTT